MAGRVARSGSSVRSYMSRAVRSIIDEAALEAAHDQVFGITTRHLLIGLLLTTDGVAQRLLTAQGVTVEAVRAYDEPSIERAGDHPDQIVTGNPFRISPIFLLVVAVTAAAGYASYANLTESGVFVFLFVLGGWFISLALHEFGHALAGYYAGDHSVANKGYLTLNPLKYTHWLLSIALPILFVIMGGIGLPGGAVYINRSVIRNERLHSLVSAAGPIATLLCTLLLALPFTLHLLSELEIYTHAEFWGGVAVLLMLEVTALLLNLLPIPGLDGYGIIEPFLSEQVRYTLRPLASVGVFILFFVLFRIDPLNDAFWMAVRGLTDLLQVDGDLIGYGYWLFRFWEM
ncbi:MAG: Clp protease N-terminal domain-containing protein [Caldilineaceae bacterium]